MKKIVILHSYPNTIKQLDVLSRCLDIHKKSDYDVMLVSHFPVPSEIYKKANYYLFDEDNEMLPAGAFPTQHFYDVGGYRAIISYKGHALPITRSMKKSISFIKSLGYEFFWFSEADCLLSDSDMAKLDQLRFRMFNEDKSMVYFKPETFRDERNNSYVYETLLFGGIPTYFLAKFKPPVNLEEWVSMDMDAMLEYSFYKKFKDDEKEFVIINDHSSTYFSDSEINIFKYGQFACEILENDIENTVVLFLHNVIWNPSNYKVIIKLNGQQIEEALFVSGFWFYRVYPLNGDLLEVDVYHEDVYSHTKTFLLDNTVKCGGAFTKL